MKYEVPEFLIIEMNVQDVIICSTQENWGTGGGNDGGDTDLDMDQFS